MYFSVNVKCWQLVHKHGIFPSSLQTENTQNKNVLRVLVLLMQSEYQAGYSLMMMMMISVDQKIFEIY